MEQDRVLWGVLQEYGVLGLLLWAVQSLYKQSESLVCIVGCKLGLFSVRVGLRQGCSLSPLLFMMFMDRISRRSQGAEGFRFGGLRISSVLFLDNVVLLAPSGEDLQLSLGHISRLAWESLSCSLGTAGRGSWGEGGLDLSA